QAARWADLHPAPCPELAATLSERGRDTGCPLAGEGTAQVDVSCLAELAAVLGLSTGAGQRLVGHALELRHRLPRLWALVHAERVPAWRARQVADCTMGLSQEAASFVDAQVSAVVGQIGPVQLERLVLAAVAEFMPAEAERRRLLAEDGRCFRVFHDTTGAGNGLSEVRGTLDLADALDLDLAVEEGARALAGAGCTESADVRRALALGELARCQPALDLTSDDAGPGADRRGAARGPRITLYLHLSAEALGRTASAQPDHAQVGRVGNTGVPVTAGQIRDWCGRPGATVTVKPVVDLGAEAGVEGYEVPDWLKEQVALRDRTCVFPWCHRAAHPRPLHDRARAQVEYDHVRPHRLGGPTSATNLAPLCLAHHLGKTFERWSYVVTEPGVYLWTSPHGRQYRRGRNGGTRALDQPAPPLRHPDQIAPPPPPPALVPGRPPSARRRRQIVGASPHRAGPAPSPSGSPPSAGDEPPPF
uniref:HNH endonuclease signature motif containing protein n=1 Tax=Desertihabitans aurantiacus TaxID=2282477 RepID=UPI0013008826